MLFITNSLQMKCHSQPAFLILQCDTRGMKTQDADTESMWVKNSVAHLVRYKPSGIYFARVRIAGKLIRPSLKTNVFSVAKIRLADVVQEKRKAAEAEKVARNGKMTFGDALGLYRENLASNR